MGADYMLIPLMAAEQFGINSLARSMAIILPANTIGQTWFPYLISFLRQHFGGYSMPMGVVFGVAMLGLRRSPCFRAELPFPRTGRYPFRLNRTTDVQRGM